MGANEPMYKAGTVVESRDQWSIPQYIYNMPYNRTKIRANRIFTNTEAVINSLIANPPQLELIATHQSPDAAELIANQERYFSKKYDDLNVKEQLRKGLRYLYLSRLIVLKPFWNADKNDFDVKVIDPRKIRIHSKATKEQESEFMIEDVDDTLSNLIAKFPEKKEDILKEAGLSEAQLEERIVDITYQEAWLNYGETVTWKYKNKILKSIKNPYWDWDGVLANNEELDLLETKAGEGRRGMLDEMRRRQESLPNKDLPDEDTNVEQDSQFNDAAYFFNYFDKPRAPYIFATILNYEQSPIGQTDFIAQASSLQESVDKRKMQIDQNAAIVNGVTLIDSNVMEKKDAASITWEAGGTIWGTNILNGVQRSTGSPLPEFVYQDMIDSREEIDNIMAATSAFRGEREGQETKAGRLALIEQSFLRLNELVQVVDYVNAELFSWFYQLAKVKYTERHYTKYVGAEKARQTLEIMQDDFLEGTEVKVISGKSLPEDKQFKYARAQADVATGVISPVDYLKDAGYENPSEVAQNAILYQLNPAKATGIPDEEIAQFAQVPQLPPNPAEGQPSELPQSEIPPQEINSQI